MAVSTPTPITPALDVTAIRDWVAEAGDIALHYFGHAKTEWKDAHNPVTVADREIERLLTAQIRRAYPDHGILGEEYGADQLDREYLWSIDPIDGTRAYIDGLPSWCVTIALLHHRVPVFGVIYIPLYDDWTYTDGDDVICNGEVITDRLRSRWEVDSFLLWRSDGNLRYNLRFPRALSMSSSASHLAYTARGAAIATLTHDFYVWDVAAGVAFMLKQGGVVRKLSGESLDFTTGDLLKPVMGMYVAGHADVVDRLRPLVEPRSESITPPTW